MAGHTIDAGFHVEAWLNLMTVLLFDLKNLFLGGRGLLKAWGQDAGKEIIGVEIVHPWLVVIRVLLSFPKYELSFRQDIAHVLR